MFLEHFANIHGGLHIDTRRTVVLRSVSDCDLTFGPGAAEGELFLEDVITHDLKLDRQRVWARQLNIENEGTHLTQHRSDVWILGYRTERGGTPLDSRAGSRTEIFGNFSYTTTAGGLAPMLVLNDSSLFAHFGEVCFNGDPSPVWYRKPKADKPEPCPRPRVTPSRSSRSQSPPLERSVAAALGLQMIDPVFTRLIRRCLGRLDPWPVRLLHCSKSPFL